MVAPHLKSMSMRVIDLPFTIIVHTDASDFGGAGFCKNPNDAHEEYFQVEWKHDLNYMRKDRARISCRELFACVTMALTFTNGRISESCFDAIT